MLGRTNNGNEDLYNTKSLYGLYESRLTHLAHEQVIGKRGAIITRFSLSLNNKSNLLQLTFHYEKMGANSIQTFFGLLKEQCFLDLPVLIQSIGKKTICWMHI